MNALPRVQMTLCSDMLRSGRQVSPPSLSPFIIHTAAARGSTSIIHVFFRAAGRKKFQSSGGGQGNSFSVPHGPAEHVFIFTVWGLGHMPPRCFTLGTEVSLHPAPIKEHKELFDSLYKPNMTNSCIVYCLIPPRLPWLCAAHHRRCAIDCSVLCLLRESNDLYRPLLTKCES